MKPIETIRRLSDELSDLVKGQKEGLGSSKQEQESAYCEYRDDVRDVIKESAPAPLLGLDRFEIMARVRAQREEGGKPHMVVRRRIHWTDRALVELKKEGLTDYRVDRTGRFGNKRNVWYSLQPNQENPSSTK
jgi:hypothetical protein